MFFTSFLILAATAAIGDGAVSISDKYDIVVDKILVVREDKTLRNTTITYRKVNRTMFLINYEVDFKFDLELNQVMVEMEIGRQINPPGYDNVILKFNYEYCAAMLSNVILAPDPNVITNEPKHCPKKKGFYYTRNANEQPNNMPAYLPYGKYRLKVAHMMNKKCIYLQYYYGTVEKKIRMKQTPKYRRGPKRG